jgi:hypothetical protein
MSSFDRFATPFFRSTLAAVISLGITSVVWAQALRDLSSRCRTARENSRSTISNPRGSLYNSVYREYRIHVLFGK